MLQGLPLHGRLLGCLDAVPNIVRTQVDNQQTFLLRRVEASSVSVSEQVQSSALVTDKWLTHGPLNTNEH